MPEDTLTVLLIPLAWYGITGGQCHDDSRDFGHIWHWPELRNRSEALHTQDELNLVLFLDRWQIVVGLMLLVVFWVVFVFPSFKIKLL